MAMGSSLHKAHLPEGPVELTRRDLVSRPVSVRVGPHCSRNYCQWNWRRTWQPQANTLVLQSASHSVARSNILLQYTTLVTAAHAVVGRGHNGRTTSCQRVDVPCLNYQRQRPAEKTTRKHRLNCLSCPQLGPSRDVAVYVFDINQPSLPTPFYFVLVSVSVFMALSTVFHSLDSPSNSPLSHSIFLVLFLPYWSFQLYISLRKSTSALI